MNENDLLLIQQNASKASNFMKKLSHPDRLLILCHLSFGELSAGELAKKSQLNLSAFSQHLAILRTAEIVQVRRESQTLYYSIKDKASLRILDTLKEIFCKHEN